MSPDAFRQFVRDHRPTAGGRCLVMGVLNVTPDSFSDGGQHLAPCAAVEHGRRLAAEGADLIDVGGESTRPGSDPVDADEQINRTLPVVRALAGAGLAVSIDTTRSEVAAAALEAGACCVNDVAAGRDDADLFVAAARTGAVVVLMHMLGRPRTMQANPTYDDVTGEVLTFFHERAAEARSAGVADEAIVFDPGIGFGKARAHNLTLLRDLPKLVAAGRPLLLGTSRKRFLGAITGIDTPADRDLATQATTARAVAAGCAMVRVHDVAAARQTIQVTRAMHVGAWPVDTEQ